MMAVAPASPIDTVSQAAPNEPRSITKPSSSGPAPAPTNTPAWVIALDEATEPRLAFTTVNVIKPGQPQPVP